MHEVYDFENWIQMVFNTNFSGDNMQYLRVVAMN